MAPFDVSYSLTVDQVTECYLLFTEGAIVFDIDTFWG